jgi:hypothetical protein
LSLAVAVVVGCGGESKPPSRDQIPVIKEAVYKLQERVKERDRAAIDSLLSARIIDNGQSTDSLLSFVYGPSGDYDFRQFGRCEIFYTKENAEARCYVMDTTAAADRPIRFSFILQDSTWLLQSFGVWQEDSLPADTAG